MSVAPDVSIVIPIYNEARMLEGAVERLRQDLRAAPFSYEILLAENGSRDGTVALAERLSQRFDEVRTFSVGEPNYGLALRTGIGRARGALVICEEIDLCDVDFQCRAVELLKGGNVDMVIGSKLMAGARDQRPLFRHAASVAYTTLLRLLLGFSGSDTHGLKAFRKAVVGDIAARCVVDEDVFASELVIRAYRRRVAIVEIPVSLREKRPPSINLLRRVPSTLNNLVRLTWAIGTRGNE
jgi:glycosyltransferase involved in cell wall biosynthesis